MTKLRICLVSSEVAPFAKTGGLADVASGLPRFLASQGHDVRIVMPLYGRVRDGDWPLEPAPNMSGMEIEFGSGPVTVSIVTTPLPGSDATVYAVDCPELFGTGDIYTDEREHLRFAVLSRAALHMCQHGGWAPHVFHCNDWHTGLLPIYLRTRYAWDQLLASARTLMTIHNIGYQGVFSTDVLGELMLEDQRHLLPERDTANGCVNYLRTGVVFADGLNTVSRTYAHEIQTEEFGMGLEGELRESREKLSGIVNGVDYGDWDPATDSLIPANFSPKDMSGKAVCRQQLLEKFGLSADPRVPILGIVARLTYQKGFQLLPEILPTLLAQHDFRLVVLGSGESKYEQFFQKLRDQHPNAVGFFRGYHNELAHWIEAGSDMFLMPSKYEPCGLNQMYSLKYGTVPVVRRTGGLADTVEPYDPARDSGTGFLFDQFEPRALYAAIRTALAAFSDPAKWGRIVERGMQQDFSWDRQGPEYERLYADLIR